MNAVILAACLLSQVPPDAVWYDERTMPPVYQNGRGGIASRQRLQGSGDK